MVQNAVIYEERDEGAWITLNRPDVLNAITPGMLQELCEFIKYAEANEKIRALVITGVGRAFSAGADLKEVDDPHPLEFRRQLLAVTTQLERSPLPIIAAINGLTLAGGFELVLACDIVFAVQSAKIGDAHAKYGMVPGGGASVRLPRKIGVNLAKEILFSSELFTANHLLKAGLINKVVVDDALQKETQAMVERLAVNSPLALARIKQVVNESRDITLQSGLELEFSIADLHDNSHDKSEGMSAFKDRRKPNFKGS